MELKIMSKERKEVGKIKLPLQFEEPVRNDLIKRALEVIQGNKRQPYGADPRAGKKYSATLSRRRRRYKGSYGHGISRVPRKILSRRGTRFNWVGAFAPGTVGGRRAFPPKQDKIWKKKINNKERRKAIRSALAAVVDREFVSRRGHKVPKEYPFVISKDFENIDKTKNLIDALKNIGVKEDLERANVKKIRAGKGKARGRKYRKRKSLLLVTGGECNLIKSAKNITGVEAVEVKNLNVELLAPGASPGRFTIFTENAINKMQNEKLFT